LPILQPSCHDAHVATGLRISSELQTECWFTDNTNTSLLPFVTINNYHIFKSYSCTGLDRPSLLQEGGKVVSYTHRPPLPPHEIPLILISDGERSDHRAIARPAGLIQ